MTKVGYVIGGLLASWIATQFELPSIDAVDPMVITGQAAIIDGDTFDVSGVRIRLYGVDAPESSQQCYRGNSAWKCGQWAAQALDAALYGKHVTCEKRGQSYNRIVAVCQVVETGQDVAAIMVRGGGAVAAPKYSTDYVDDEKKARLERAGIWGSEFEKPWLWRKNH